MSYNYDDVKEVIKLQRDNEGFVRDMRRQSKEAIDFVSKRDGQWEPSIISKFKGRPRYTDDRVNPIINQMVGELFQAEFTGRVRPAGDNSTKDTAKVLDGLVRTIRNKSNFKRIINQTGKRVAISGIGGWEIVKDYTDPLCFDYDILIQNIDDFHERVLIDSNSMSPVGEDAQWAIIKHYVGKDEFKKKFGEDKKVVSLGHDDWSDSYYYKPDNVTIGQLYYLKDVKKEIVRMNDGSVYEVNEEFEMVRDELELQGIIEDERREVDDYICCQRWYSADEWLTDEEELDFNFVPVVPCYGNFDVTEGKVTYYGAVERLMDIQRVHNYAFTRNVEEVALSPRSKWYMTPEQAAGHEKSLRTMNTNMDPVQLYNHVADQTPPFYSDTSSASQALSNLIALTDDGINKASGIFAANIGDNPNVQSGIAIQEQIDRGNNGTAWLFESLEMSIEQTCKLLLRAIPKTYDGTREIVLTGDDGSLETMVINQPVMDEQTQETVYLYDVTQGQYDVVVDIGAGYKNRQKEAVQAFERLAATDPALMELGRDIHLNNLEAPNMDLVAERARQMMLQQGLIPEEQLTDEERALIQQQQQMAAQTPPQEDPAAIQLRVAETQANTAMMAEQNEAQRSQIKMQELQIKAAGQQEKLQSDLQVDAAKIQQEQEKINLLAQKQEEQSLIAAMEAQAKQQQAQFNQLIEAQKAQSEQLMTLANVLAKLKDATGADAIMDQNAITAYSQTAAKLSDEAGS